MYFILESTKPIKKTTPRTRLNTITDFTKNCLVVFIFYRIIRKILQNAKVMRTGFSLPFLIKNYEAIVNCEVSDQN